MPEKSFHLKEIIDVKMLQSIEEKFAQITDIAFVTVDYKGEPITQETNFTEFCKQRRKSPLYKALCYRSDAHGGFEAAITQKPYYFKCPVGLVDFAVPIIVQQQYLGAVLCGQVRCNDTPDLVDFSTRIQDDQKWKEDPHMNKLLGEVPVKSFDDIVSTAELLHLIITQLAEKEMMSLIREDLTRKELSLIEEKNARAELEKEYNLAMLKSLKSQTNPHFLFNVLNSIGRLALIENAERTQEMACVFSEMLRYNIKNHDRTVEILDDLENIERYLKIQEIRFGKKVSYQVDIDEDVPNIDIPPFIIMPFVENAMKHGIEKKANEGIVKIHVFMEKENVVVEIKDDGVGMPAQKLKHILEDVNVEVESESTGFGIQNTRKRLMHQYGEKYDILMQSKINEGTTVSICIPV